MRKCIEDLMFSRESWEYTTVQMAELLDVSSLQARGADGWELVSVVTREDQTVAYMKRSTRRKSNVSHSRR